MGQFAHSILKTRLTKLLFFRFYVEVAIYLVYFALSGIVLILKRLYFDYLEEIGCVAATDTERKIISECSCAYLYTNDPNARFRICLEIVQLMV